MQRGTLIASRFEILDRIRARGNSQVFMGRDHVSDQSVAIKFLEEGSYGAERFAREVSLLTELNHPSIVRYIAHGTLGRRPYLVMEWVQGRPLSHFLTEGLTLRESVAVTRRVAEALAVVHLRGVVHRDVHPSNIVFVDGDLEQVKLIDFGFVRQVGQPGLTRTGTIIGTPGYLSPEQARGDWDVDGRSDVFSLGCVLYTCLSGMPPFSAQHLLATLIKVVFQDPVPLAERCQQAPDDLLALVRRMLAKDRLARPNNAAVVVEDLDALDALPETARRAPAPTTANPFGGRFSADQRPTHGAVPSALAPSLDRAPDALVLLIGLDGHAAEGLLDRPGEGGDALAAFLDRAHAAVAERHGESAMLADGTLAAVFPGGSSHAELAAETALRLRALVNEKLHADAPMVLGVKGDVLDNTALDRLVQLLIEESFHGVLDDVEVPPTAIRLGDELRELLPASFAVEQRGRALYLMAQSP